MQETVKLSKEEIEAYYQQGYLGPYTLCSPEEMAEHSKEIETFVTDKPGAHQHNRHLDNKTVYNLCAHAAITDRLAGLLGENIVLWRSNFFAKFPGDSKVPWHQDGNYWPIEPVVNISAWLAIDDVRIENSCVQLIPGSHRKILPHVQNDDLKYLKEEIPDHYIDTSKTIPMELKPGQFFLFNEKLLHYSAPNTSDKRRIGLAIRNTIPMVKVFDDAGDKEFILTRGADSFGLNRYVNPPQ